MKGPGWTRLAAAKYGIFSVVALGAVGVVAEVKDYSLAGDFLKASDDVFGPSWSSRTRRRLFFSFRNARGATAPPRGWFRVTSGGRQRLGTFSAGVISVMVSVLLQPGAPGLLSSARSRGSLSGPGVLSADQERGDQQDQGLVQAEHIEHAQATASRPIRDAV